MMKYSILAIAAVFIGTIALEGAACGKSSQGEGQLSTAAHGQVETDPEVDQLKDKAKIKNGFQGMPPVGTKAVCPVMGNEFTVTKQTESSVYQGKTYVFCCAGCKPAFEKNPKKYLKK